MEGLVANVADGVQQYGVKETLEVLDFGLAIAGDVSESFADKKFDLSDVMNFKETLVAVAPALENIALVPKELMELSPSELVVIQQHVLAKMPQVGEKWLVVAQNAIQIAVSMYNIWTAVKK